MNDFLSAKELSVRLGMTKRGVQRLAARKGWEFKTVRGNGGERKLFNCPLIKNTPQQSLVDHGKPFKEWLRENNFKSALVYELLKGEMGENTAVILLLKKGGKK